MNSIFQFDNHEDSAKKFREIYLEPKLANTGLANQTLFSYQDYIDANTPGAPILAPDEVARQGYIKWERIQPTPHKTVWIFDLDATASSTPDSSFGLCVMIALAKFYGLSIEQFLSNDSFLCVILTLYPASLRTEDGISKLRSTSCNLSHLASLWPRVNIIQKNPAKDSLPLLSGKTHPVKGVRSPRLLFADARLDDAWLAGQIIEWVANNQIVP